MREVNAIQGKKLFLGRCGENMATCVTFDISEWQRIYGDGTVQLIHQRNGDKIPYPCVIEQIDNIVTWCITNADVDHAGRGRAELQYFVDEVYVKSDIYTTVTERALSKASETAPEPYDRWMDEMLSAASDAVESAENAAESEANAKAAQEAAERARDAAQEIIGGDYPTTEYIEQLVLNAENAAKEHADENLEQHNESETAHADIREGVENAQSAASNAQNTADEAKTAADEAMSAAENLKPTYIQAAMLASEWTDHTYSFEADYPSEQYNISIEVAPTATAEQFEAFGGAMICGSVDSNVATALGDVPTVDIPVIIKAVRK